MHDDIRDPVAVAATVAVAVAVAVEANERASVCSGGAELRR